MRQQTVPLIGAVLAGLIAFAPSARSISQRQREMSALASSRDISSRNSNAFAMILGEFRASLADFMFIKTERYLDSGIAYAPHINVDAMAKAEGKEASEFATRSNESDKSDKSDHPGEDPEDHPETAILTSQKDFRGFLGDLEREVKPYRDPRLPHQHTTGEELLPWYRLMTLANPHQVRPYLIGAMWLSQQGHAQEAVDFLREGVGQNRDHPELFRLHLALITTYVKMHHGDSDAAWMEEALEEARKARNLGLRQRARLLGNDDQPLLTPSEQWGQDLEEDLILSAHYVTLLSDRLGNREAAIEAARRLHQIAPKFAPNNALLRQWRKQSVP